MPRPLDTAGYRETVAKVQNFHRMYVAFGSVVGSNAVNGKTWWSSCAWHDDTCLPRVYTEKPPRPAPAKNKTKELWDRRKDWRQST